MKNEETNIGFIDLTDITGITLLSIEEYTKALRNIPRLYGQWWLRSPGAADNTAAFVYPAGNVSCYGAYVGKTFGVRPALLFDPERLNLTIGTKVRIGGVAWTHIAENILLCDNILRMMPFCKEPSSLTANYYETSDVRKFLEEWLEDARLQNETVKKYIPIIEKHKHWLYENCPNWKEMFADLDGADLHGISLSGVVLRHADMHDADLSGADLHNAKLNGANLEKTDLHNVDLHNADLGHADLRDANLRNANLRDANLQCADLRGADLHGADLRGVDLDDADLHNAKNVPYIPMACPESGEFTGWKQARGCIVELVIPKDANRLSGTGRVCRCDKAFVKSILDENGVLHDDPKEGFCVQSFWDREFVYRVGEMVTANEFDWNRFATCTYGIHFFVTRQEAIDY